MDDPLNECNFKYTLLQEDMTRSAMYRYLIFVISGICDDFFFNHKILSILIY